MKLAGFFAAMMFAVVGMTSMAVAQDFEFEAGGDGSVEWNLQFEQTEEFTATSGAEFDFNGGAGSDGEAYAEGDAAVTYGNTGQYAGGNGYAIDDNGNTYATAQYASGSYAESGGFAADVAFNDKSEVSFGGLISAGGAGGAGTGESVGYEYIATQNGSGDFNYNVDLSSDQD